MIFFLPRFRCNYCISCDCRIESHRVLQSIYLVAKGPIVLINLDRLRYCLSIALILNDIHPRHHVQYLHVGVWHGDLRVLLQLQVQFLVIQAEGLSIFDFFLD